MNLGLTIVALLLAGLASYFCQRSQRLAHALRQLQHQTGVDDEAFASEVMQSNKELASKSIDALTGLPVRAAFDDRIQQALTQCQRYQHTCALLLLDIDNFNAVNQTSAEAGERVLRELSQRIQGCLRQVDSVSRYASNSFLILLPRITQPEGAAFVAQRIQDGLLQPFATGVQDVFLTVSMGIALYPMDAGNAEELLQHAHQALRNAKQYGKNQYRFYESDISQLSKREQTIVASLQTDYYRDQLSVQFLPQVQASTGHVLGVQAIPCLTHSELGEVYWSAWSHLAESTGKSTEIISWLAHTLWQQARNQTVSPPQWFAISTRLHQLENTHFVDQMAKLLQEPDMQKCPLVFEIIDSPCQTHSTLLEKGLMTLSTLGARFAIEVHALGHGALKKFSNLPLLYLKINATMTQRCIEVPDHGAILTAMIEACRSAGIHVLADGVENVQQKMKLQQLGCDVLQGKLFDAAQTQQATEITEPRT